MRQNISLVVGIARIESRAEIAGTAIAVVPSAPVHPDTVTHGHGDTYRGPCFWNRRSEMEWSNTSSFLHPFSYRIAMEERMNGGALDAEVALVGSGFLFAENSVF